MKYYSETPILILIFNRPDKVRQLIDRLREFKPRQLFVSADGPRPDKIKEDVLCREAQAIVKNHIDWPCTVATSFSDVNMGCKKGVSTGITWFFEHVDQGIILEDDCLPTESFLIFATEMLEAYQNNQQVMHINGTSFLPATNVSISDYYFLSRLAHSWGWATWRRAWDKFDPDMKDLDSLRESLLRNEVFLKKKHTNFWVKHFKHIKNKQVDSWANPWLYSILKNNGLCLTPRVNLIDNIGFDIAASNTKTEPSFTRKTQKLELSLPSPNSLAVNKQADSALVDLVFRKSFWVKLSSKVKKCYDAIVR